MFIIHQIFWKIKKNCRDVQESTATKSMNDLNYSVITRTLTILGWSLERTVPFLSTTGVFSQILSTISRAFLKFFPQNRKKIYFLAKPPSFFSFFFSFSRFLRPFAYPKNPFFLSAEKVDFLFFVCYNGKERKSCAQSP